MSIANRIILGRIAENIVSEMLRDSGYFVYRFGYDGVLQNLIQNGNRRMRRNTASAEKIRTMPDFVAMDQTGELFLIEVKYRDSVENDRYFREWLRLATRHWPEAKIILIHPYEPFFQISTISDYMKNGKLYPLERDKFLHVSRVLVERYAELIEKYLR